MTMKFRISATNGQLPAELPREANLIVKTGPMGNKWEEEFISIEIVDLAHLMAFCEKYGPLVIDTMLDPPSLEIYNDYRE